MVIVSITIAASISVFSVVAAINMLLSCFRPPAPIDDYNINSRPSDYLMLDNWTDASDPRWMISNCKPKFHRSKSSNDVKSLD
uniref:Uncharacterized protein n=1 Tax=Caenorhabditis japonica TaxID=281687 RepID=A0A8R1HUF7_CAEJA